MFKLIANEQLKLYRRARTWIFNALVLAALIVVCLVVHAKEHNQTAWTFLNISANLIELVAIFVAVIAGDIVANEFSSGAIKLLLVRPVNRTRILFAKYITVILYSFTMVVLLYVVAWVLGGIVFGFQHADALFQVMTTHGHTTIPIYQETFRTFAFSFVSLIMVITVSFMISTLFRSSSISIAISVLLYFVGPVIALALHSFAWDKFLLFTDMQLSQFYEGAPLVSGLTLGFAVTMLIIYFLVFHIVAWWSFTKRDVAS